MLKPIDESLENGLLAVLNEIKADHASRNGVGSWTENALKDSIHKDLVWVDENDGEIASFLVARPIPDGHEILLLGTTPTFQRKGRMEGLLKGWLSRLGPGQKVWLEVNENNLAARNLYEKCGFIVTGSRPRYYPDGGAALQLEFKV